MPSISRINKTSCKRILNRIYHSLMCICFRSKGISTRPMCKIVIRIFVTFIHFFVTLQTFRKPIFRLTVDENMVSFRWNTFGVISWRICLMPDHISFETVCSENIIADCTKPRDLIIVNRDKYCTFIGEQLSQKYQTRIHHTEPFVMACEILSLCSDYFTEPSENMRVVYIIIVTPFLIPCIVRRIYINAVYSSFIFRKERFEGGKIITMNYLIPCSAYRRAVRTLTIKAITMLQYAERHIGMMGDNLFFSNPVERRHFEI